METEADTGVMQPQAQGPPGHQELQRQEGPSSDHPPPQGSTVLGHLDFFPLTEVLGIELRTLSMLSMRSTT